jgi:two-component system chemotaxis response regulator CheB
VPSMRHPEPPPKQVIGVGTSAGGLAALIALLRGLPSDFSIPLLVVQHLSRDHRSRLVQLLQPCTRLRVEEAQEGVTVTGGHVYIAPADRHLEVDTTGRIRILDKPPVSFSRPSVDVLFASLAHSFGSRCVVVVLTGAGSDGSRGARAVHDAGGVVIAQDKSSSYNFGMPQAAIASGTVDHVLPLGEIGPFLQDLEANMENSS